MKKITKALSILTLCVFIGVSNPVMAQTTGSDITTETRNNDDDTGKWGLAGLLGLLGLLGLRKRDDDKHRNTSVNR